MAAYFMGIAGAQAGSVDLALKELSQCDATFFEVLGSRRSELAAVAPMRTLGNAAAFAVPDRKHPSNSRIMFAEPVTLEGLKVVGFFDEVVDIPNGMSGYSWGYLVANSVRATADKLGPQIWDAPRLRVDGPVYVRSEVWIHENPASGWAKVKTEAGVPKRGTVERVLLIEPYDGETAFIRFGCSIQGNVTEPILRRLRPDLRQ